MADPASCGHGGGMPHLPGCERYRVRKAQRREDTIPDEVEAPRFPCLAEADQYARALHKRVDQRVIVEKRAAGGCWFTLSEHT